MRISPLDLDEFNSLRLLTEAKQSSLHVKAVFDRLCRRYKVMYLSTLLLSIVVQQDRRTIHSPSASRISLIISQVDID